MLTLFNFKVDSFLLQHASLWQVRDEISQLPTLFNIGNLYTIIYQVIKNVLRKYSDNYKILNYIKLNVLMKSSIEDLNKPLIAFFSTMNLLGVFSVFFEFIFPKKCC